MNTLELIAEQLWNKGWNATWSYFGNGACECRLFWRHVDRPKNTVVGSGSSLLLAIEHARDELLRRERDK